MARDRSRITPIEVRIAPAALALVKRAAEIEGQGVSEFITAAAQQAARRTIKQARIIRLSVEDQRAFAEVVLNPPPPTSALMRAAKAYRTLIKASR